MNRSVGRGNGDALADERVMRIILAQQHAERMLVATRQQQAKMPGNSDQQLRLINFASDNISERCDAITERRRRSPSRERLHLTRAR